MKKSLVIANWKMNLDTGKSSLLLHRLERSVKHHRSVEVVLCPSMMALQSMSLQVNHRHFKLGAQNCYWRDSGAYTGEVSAAQLHGVCQYVLVGHSERRHVFNEHEKDIRHKVQAVLRNNMKPVLCIGETAHERADGETTHVLHDQIVSGLLNVTSDDLPNVVIAYEPVWAIGTGDSATTVDVDKATKVIRSQIESLYGKKAAESVSILYGGSVNVSNTSEYMALPHVDGLLVGGASLKGAEFSEIIEKAYKVGVTKGDNG